MTPADRTWCGPEGESGGGGEGCVYKAEAKVAASNLSPSFAMNVLVSAVLSSGVSPHLCCCFSPYLCFLCYHHGFTCFVYNVIFLFTVGFFV